MNDLVKKNTIASSQFVSDSPSETVALSEFVEQSLKDYFKHLDGHQTANLYTMLLAEVEVPLLKATLEHVNDNQSRAAEILGINRGTLRKKIKSYGL